MPLPNIQIGSTLSDLGVFFVILGIILILGGLGLAKVDKVTATQRKATWITGTIIWMIGVVLLLPEFINVSRIETTETTVLLYRDVPEITIGTKDNYSLKLPNRQLVEFFIVDAHDNVESTTGASLVCELDSRQMGEQDVKKQGSRLFYPVNMEG